MAELLAPLLLDVCQCYAVHDYSRVSCYYMIKLCSRANQASNDLLIICITLLAVRMSEVMRSNVHGWFSR